MVTKKKEALTDERMATLVSDWGRLNAFLMHEADEESVEQLLAYERKNKNRKTIVARIHSRRNRCRYQRERRELGVA